MLDCLYLQVEMGQINVTGPNEAIVVSGKLKLELNLN